MEFFSFLVQKWGKKWILFQEDGNMIEIKVFELKENIFWYEFWIE